MNKDLINDEMSRKLESEYKNLVFQDVPDLWSRIEANLEPKQQPNNIVNENSNKKVVSFKKRYKAWGTVAAACACVAIALPVFINTLNNKNEFTASEEMATPDFVANEDLFNKNSDMNDMFIDDFEEQLEVEHNDRGIISSLADYGFAETVTEEITYTLTVEILNKDTSDEDIVYTAIVLKTDENCGIEENEEIIIHESIFEDNVELDIFEEYELKLIPDVNDFGENIYRLINE